MKLNHKDVYSGQYRGVGFEIVNWGERADDENRRHTHNWNYYIYLKTNHFVDPAVAKTFILKKKLTKLGKRKVFLYDTCSFGPDLEFHGGLTHYSLVGDKNDQIIKLGCDYGHLYDEPWYLNKECIAGDCQKTINMFKEDYPYHNWCQGDGSLVLEKDGYYMDAECSSFYSKKYVDTLPPETREKWLKGAIDGAKFSGNVEE